MKNILVPLGSGGNAPNTLQYAIDLAGHFGAAVYITQVYESTRIAGSLKNIDALLQEETDAQLEDILRQVDRKDVDVQKALIKGAIVNSIEALSKHLEIDLIVSSAKSISRDETLYLGRIAGSLVKDIDVPVLIVPSQYRFKPVSKILMAIKSGKIKPGSVLEPLKKIVSTFKAEIDLIQIITPKATDEDKEVNGDLRNLAATFKTTENATIFQGVLEHLHITEPDMLCVMRRKRGFFAKLWEKNAVKKSYFESRIPLLVLKGIA